MRIFVRAIKYFLSALVILAIAGLGYLYVSPPAQLQLATQYSAKILCSATYVSRLPLEMIKAQDLRAPSQPVHLLSTHIDREKEEVTASLFGFISKRKAKYYEGYGCISLPEGDAEISLPPRAQVQGLPLESELWPRGERVEKTKPEIMKTITNPKFAGEGMRAVIVVHKGKIVAENYAKDISPETQLLGWSMTKTVTALISATLIDAGKLSFEQTSLLAQWNNDVRQNIRLEDILGMSSGLAWSEVYDGYNLSNVIVMLMNKPDMAAFAAERSLVDEDIEKARKVFNYSTGDALLLSRIWQEAAGEAAYSWAALALFDRLFMRNWSFETDVAGTFVGGSYLYASARDWARLATLIANGGQWGQEQVIAQKTLARMLRENPHSNGRYAMGQIWMRMTGHRKANSISPGSVFALPQDTRWMFGHDGQNIAIIPSMDLVVLRMGMTPNRFKYGPLELVEQVARQISEMP